MILHDESANPITLFPKTKEGRVMPVSLSGFSDSSAVDAFGRLRTSQPFTLFDSKQIFDSNPLFWDDAQTSGSGTTSVWSSLRASSLMGVSINTAGRRVRQTKRRFNYQPGKSQAIILTAIMGSGTAGVTKRVGYFYENDGLFFELSGTTLKVVQRSSATGSITDTSVAQVSWNIDKMDGTGDSGISLDLSKTQIFIIDFEWLGVGRVRFGFIVNGIIYYCHEFLNGNNLDLVYMATPNLPVRYEISNDGTGNSSTLEHICSTVISEGGLEKNGAIFSTSNGNTQVDANTAGTNYACIGLRLRSTHLGAFVDTFSISILGSTANDNFHWQVLLNPTVASTFIYEDVLGSSVQAAKGATANTVTGGYLIGSGYGGKQTSISESVFNTIGLGSRIDGTRDTLVLSTMPIGAAANLDIYSSMTWRELH